MSHTVIPKVSGFEMQLPGVVALPEIGRIYPDISFDQWGTYMADVWQTDTKWILRSWQSAHRLTLIDEPLPESGHFVVGDLGIDLARQGVRKVETGSRSLPAGVGRVCWNGVALLNNRAVSKEENLILPWNDDIHPLLATTLSSRRRRVAQHLHEMYEALHSDI